MVDGIATAHQPAMLTFKFIGGVFIAICAGVVLNMGSLLQKKAVNHILRAKIHNIQDDTSEYDKYLAFHMSTWYFY